MDVQRLITLLGGTVELAHKARTVSTNDDAKALAREGRLPVLVVADEQSGGRGRRGNSFASPAGGIYLLLRSVSS